MIKFIGILCIFAASSASGLAMSDRIKCTRNRLEKERKMLEEISVMIRFSSLTLREIADELNRSDTYSEISFVRLLVSKAEQTCFPKAWEESVLGDRNLTESERKLFWNSAKVLAQQMQRDSFQQLTYIRQDLMI